MGKGHIGDFLSFWIDDTHSSDLGLTRVSDGSRYTKTLLPSFKDETAEVPGGDGTYYYGSRYEKREIPVKVAFDNLSEVQLRQITQLLGDQQMHRLVFDEEPYKEYVVKVSKAPEFKYLCFEEKGQRVYKGEGELSFVCYDGYARARTGYKWLEDYDLEIFSNRDEWLEASKISSKTFGWKILIGGTHPEHTHGVENPINITEQITTLGVGMQFEQEKIYRLCLRDSDLTSNKTYYPKYTGNETSFLEALSVLGIDNNEDNLQNIAEKNGLSFKDASGNEKSEHEKLHIQRTLLEKLKKGELIEEKPEVIYYDITAQPKFFYINGLGYKFGIPVISEVEKGTSFLLFALYSENNEIKFWLSNYEDLPWKDVMITLYRLASSGNKTWEFDENTVNIVSPDISTSTFYVYNNGDIEIPFKIKFLTTFSATMGIYLNNELILIIKPLREYVLGFDKIGYQINSKTHLIEGLLTDGSLSGDIFNDSILSGGFRNLKIGENIIEIKFLNNDEDSFSRFDILTNCHIEYTSYYL